METYQERERSGVMHVMSIMMFRMGLLYGGFSCRLFCSWHGRNSLLMTVPRGDMPFPSWAGNGPSLEDNNQKAKMAPPEQEYVSSSLMTIAQQFHLAS